MSDVWFTSDTHFGHEMLVREGHRPFRSVAEMDAELVERWNATVRPRDVVWHLGDFGMGGMSTFLEVVGKLHGTKHFVAGNHDHVWSGHRGSERFHRTWIEAGFASVQDFSRRRILGHNVLLSHFPYVGDHVGPTERFVEYRLRDTGLWLLHGHVHSLWTVKDRMINVGVDVHEFTPVNLEHIAAIIDGSILDGE